ncbi:ras-related protein rab-5c [Anaeramoeba flamelloides]|uniref:Ras-related protein rab-5c n=1 Tax=Anaeramoeba flamelloides TaxID=1746091 RepID=A0ABQ8X159_9EUKA|nr:ras-related protein rab-5c [Anaeramoeba flamelloides]
MIDFDSHEYKVVLLGDSGVGKSCLVLRFVRNEFFDNREPTIGASYLTKSLTVSEKEIKLQIWDTAGQERYQSLAPMYYRGSEVAIIVFDITSNDSYSRAKQWVDELYEKGIPDLIIGFVGNKSDLEEKRAIKKSDAKEYCSLHNLHYFETSAKTSKNVNEMFFSLAQELTKIPEKIEKKDKKKSKISEIMIEPQDPKKKKSCC